MKNYRFDVWGISDVGAVKTVNQDAFLYKVVNAGGSYAAMLAVADGIGGLQAGETASAIAVYHLGNWWETAFRKYYPSPEMLQESLLVAAQKINQDVLALSAKNGVKMGTTLDVLLLHQGYYYLLHVGDSRIYLLPKGKGDVQQLTEDHSRFVPQEATDGTIRGRYMLTSCLGYSETFSFAQTSGQLHGKDCFLVCSDGVYKTLSAGQIGKIVQKEKGRMQSACASLISAAKMMGETDNITAVSVRVDA